MIQLCIIKDSMDMNMLQRICPLCVFFLFSSLFVGALGEGNKSKGG